MRYKNFDIRIASASKEPYTVTATSATGKTAKGKLSLGDPLREELRRIQGGGGDLDALKEFGARLHEQLLEDGIGILLAESEGGAAPLRVRFCVESPEASAIPWETIYRKEQNRFLSASASSALVRYVKNAEPILGLKLEPPVNVLVVAPGGAGSRLGDMVETFERLSGDLFSYTVLEGGATEAAFRSALSDGTYHVLHFVGEAGCEGSADHLVLDAEAGTPERLPAESFAGLVAGGQSVKLVVLECPGDGTDAGRRLLARIATRLVKAGVPAVVAMQFPAGKQSAKDFTEQMYRELCGGAEPGRIDAAVTRARERVLLDDSADFAAPVLFLGAGQGLIFYFDGKGETAAEGGGRIEGFFKKLGRRLWPFAGRASAARRARKDLLRDAEATHRQNVALLRAKAKRVEPDARGRLDEQIKEERDRVIELEDKLWPWGKTLLVAFVFSLLVAAVSEFHLLNMFGNVDEHIDHWIADYANARRKPAIDTDEIALVLLDRPEAQDAAAGAKDDTAARRQRLAELLPKLRAAGARVVALDVLFDEQTGADGVLARAIAEAQQPPPAEPGRPPMRVLAATERVEGGGAQPAIGAKELAAVLGGYGVVEVAADEKTDEVVRRAELGRYLGGQPDELVDELPVYPSLALRAVMEYRRPGSGAFYDFNRDEIRVGLPRESPEDLRVPAQNPFFDKGGKVEQRALFRVYFAGDGAVNDPKFFPRYSSLLKGGEDEFKRKFRDRIVLVTFPDDDEGRDTFNVPNGKPRRGVAIHANVISNILKGQYLVRVPFTYRYLIVALMVAAGLLLHTRFARMFRSNLGFKVPLLSDAVQVPLVICVVAALYLIPVEFLYEHALLVCDVTYPLAALVVTYGAFGLARRAVTRD